MYGQEMRWQIPGRKRKLLAFADLHFCETLRGKRIDYIERCLTQATKREQVDYMVFLGDLIDAVDVLDDRRLKEELEGFLKRLAKLTPLLIVSGNHDISHYGEQKIVDQAGKDKWWGWLKDLSRRNQRIYAFLEGETEQEMIYDDGVMRVLGLNLPETCYPTDLDEEAVSAEEFRKYAETRLSQLMAVPEREYYLLTHNPQFLSTVRLDSKIAVLTGHMHNGLIPPVVDELLRFTHRGLIGPGYHDSRGQKWEYIPLAKAARYRPTLRRPWLTLNSCAHLPRDNWMWKWDKVFPAVSYAIVEGGEKLRFRVRYFKKNPGRAGG